MSPSGSLGKPYKIKEPVSEIQALTAFVFVGVTRLELATSRPPDAYSNQLSYTPIGFQKRCKGSYFF